jgi:hypothetical protein
VIIGPRTMQQLGQALGGASLTLDDATLDRTDQIVPPGTDLYRVKCLDPAVAGRPGPAAAPRQRPGRAELGAC